MILPLLMALQRARVPVDPIVEPGDEIRFEAAILLPPKLDREERTYLPALAAAMSSATVDYPASMVRTITDGRTLRVDALPDALRVSFGVNANAGAAGVDLMNSILSRPALGEPARALPPSGFYAPVLGEATLGPVPAEELQTLFRKVVRPDRLRIAIVGPDTAPLADKLRDRLSAMPAKAEPPRYRAYPALKIWNSDDPYLVLRGPTVPYGSEHLSEVALAWAAVGVGKGSALFRAAREELGMSYRQEALLVPSDEGFVPTILISTDTPDKEALRKSLLADIETWTDSDVARAKGVLRANLETGLAFSPWLVSTDGPPTNDAADRGFLAAYWPLRTGKPWNPLYWAIDLKAEEMKKIARETVVAAN